MGNIDFQKIAALLEKSERTQCEVIRITEEYPTLSIEDGYQIQEEIVKIKTQQGHHVVGPKMGLTSKAKMDQMNVDKPIYGYVFDYMVVSDEGNLSMNELIHPKIEAEIAFVMGQDIGGDDVTAEEVLKSIKYIVPAMEIIDSRYKDFKFTLPDVIADNTSASRMVLGTQKTEIGKLELDKVKAELWVNGELKESGTGAAVLGNPVNSVVMLAKMLSQKGKKVMAGDIVLTGALVQAVRISAGDRITAKFEGLGDVSITVSK